MCRLSQIYLTGEILAGNRALLREALERTERVHANICSTSFEFSLKKLELTVLQLNIQQEFHWGAPCRYELPLEVIYKLYKNMGKWNSKRKLKSFNLVLKHIYCSLITYSATENNRAFEMAVYQGWREVENVKMYTSLPFTAFKRKLFEYMSTFCELVGNIRSQRMELNFFATKYFHLGAIMALPNHKALTVQDPITGNPTKINNSSECVKSRRLNTKRRLENKPDEHKYLLKDFSHKFTKIKANIIQDIFDLIEESESDEEGDYIYSFEKERRKNLERNNSSDHISLSIGQGEKKNPMNEESTRIMEKVNELKEKSEKFRSFSQAAIKELQTRRNAYYKIDDSDGDLRMDNVQEL